MSNLKWTDGMIAELLACRAYGMGYPTIAKKMNKMYGQEFTADAVRFAYKRYKHLAETAESVGNIKVLKEIARIRRANSQVAKENRTILQHLNSVDDVVDQIAQLVKDLPKLKTPKLRYESQKGRTHLTCELMLSDLHFGKQTAHFNLTVARQRLQQYVATVIAELDRRSKTYNIDKLVVFIGGDLIENALIHGPESLAGCEFQNPEQVRHCTESLFVDVIRPLAELGVPMHMICIAGNHCRQEPKKTYQQEGKNSLAWIIYQTLRLLCQQSGMDHITWDIPDGVYTVYEIYGDLILYEHGHHIRSYTKDGYAKHIAARSAQIGKLIKGLRHGHLHSYLCMDEGVVVANSSLCGQDSYSDARGYRSRPGQVMNFYCKTKNRDNSFYQSFLIQLGSTA